MATTSFDVVANLVAKTASFERGMKKANKSLKTIERSARSFQKVLRFATTALAAFGTGASVGGIAIVARRAIETNDALGKMATRLGIASDELRILQIAADLSGQKMQALNVGLQRMVRRIAEAAVGTGEAQAAIKTLGLNAQELAGLAPDQVFRKLAEAMQGVVGRGQQIQLAFKLLDTEGVGLINTMDLLSTEGFKKVEEDARRMGAVLSELDVSIFEGAKDELTLIGLAFEGISNSIGRSIIPLIFIFEERITKTAIAANSVTKEFESWGKRIAQSFGFLVGLGQAVTNLQTLALINAIKLTRRITQIFAELERFVINILLRIPLIGEKFAGVDRVIAGSVDRLKEAEESLQSFRDSLGDPLSQLKEYGEGWDRAEQRMLDAARAIQELKDAQAATQKEFDAFLQSRLKGSDADKGSIAAATKLKSIIEGTRTATERTVEKIFLLRDALVEATDPARIKELQTAIGRLAQTITIDIDTQDVERFQKIQSLIASARTSEQRQLDDIKLLTDAIANGEGKINDLIKARLQLTGQLDIKPQIAELTDQLSELERLGDVVINATVLGDTTGLIDEARKGQQSIDSLSDRLREIASLGEVVLPISIRSNLGEIDQVKQQLASARQSANLARMEFETLETAVNHLANIGPIAAFDLQINTNNAIANLQASEAKVDALTSKLARLQFSLVASITADASGLLDEIRTSRRAIDDFSKELLELDRLGQIDLPINIKTDIQQITNVQVALRNAEASAKVARARFNELQSQFERFGRETVSVEVELQVSQAEANLRQIDSQVVSLRSRLRELETNVVTNITANTEQARTQIQALIESIPELSSLANAEVEKQLKALQAFYQRTRLSLIVELEVPDRLKALNAEIERLQNTGVIALSAEITADTMQAQAAIQTLIDATPQLAELASATVEQQLTGLLTLFDSLRDKALLELARGKQQLGEFEKPLNRSRAIIDAWGKGLISANEKTALLRQTFQQIGDVLDESLDVEKKTDQMAKFAERAAENMQDAFADFFKGTEEGFNGLLKSFARLLRDMAAELLVQQLLTTFFSGFAGKGGFLGGIADSLFAKRAAGGQLAAFQPAIVGEKGPELFVPRTSGMVVPNNKIGGGTVIVNSAPTINFQGDRADIPALLRVLDENNRNLEARIITRLRSRAT